MTICSRRSARCWRRSSTRPLSVTVRGFRSYAGEHTFDFRDRRLVGIVGPIGSGKSSLLDAVAFALYGKTPTFERDTRSLINQRAAAAHVELWFEAGGEHWRAVRVLRVQGQAAHAIYRHAADDPQSERLEEVTGARAVTEKVEQLLGLDFAAFRRSILLAQNEFAGFLRAAPGDRDAVLKGVFGFDKVEEMQAVARARRDATRRDLEELERRRREVEADQVALEAARARGKEASERAALFDGAAERIAEADASIAAATTQEREAADQRAALDQLAARLPDRRRADELVGAGRGAAEAIARAEAAAAASQAELAAAEERLAATLEDVGGQDALAAARLAVARLGDRSAAAAQVAQLVAAAEKDRDKAIAAREKAAAMAEAAAASQAAAASALEAAQTARREAAADLHEARHADAAAELRTTLAAGEPCPVCGQEVATPPKAGRRPGLAAKEKALAKAERAEEKAAAKLQAASAAAATHTSALAVADERMAAAADTHAARVDELAAAHAAVAAAEDEGRDLLGPGDPGELLAAAEERLARATSDLAQARRAHQEATAARAAASLAAADAAEGLRALGTELAALAGRLDAELEVPADPDGVAAALEAVRAAWERAVADAEAAAAAARTAREKVAAARAALLAKFDLAPGADFAAARRQAAADAAAVAREIELLEARVARFAELEKDNAAAVARLAVYDRLTGDLAPARFLRYLLAEERRGLADLGSDRFELLSGGRYRFSDDGTFGIVDLAAAEAERRPESLSGGETFLASLALALALAEMVTRSGGRLDAFFLDEGFGSLDREHLDLAMEGIERLVADSPDRLVVLVSHVAEMSHRMEDLIELDRDPVTGATQVVRA